MKLIITIIILLFGFCEVSFSQEFKDYPEITKAIEIIRNGTSADAFKHIDRRFDKFGSSRLDYNPILTDAGMGDGTKLYGASKYDTIPPYREWFAYLIGTNNKPFGVQLIYFNYPMIANDIYKLLSESPNWQFGTIGERKAFRSSDGVLMCVFTLEPKNGFTQDRIDILCLPREKEHKEISRWRE